MVNISDEALGLYQLELDRRKLFLEMENLSQKSAEIVMQYHKEMELLKRNMSQRLQNISNEQKELITKVAMLDMCIDAITNNKVNY